MKWKKVTEHKVRQDAMIFVTDGITVRLANYDEETFWTLVQVFLDPQKEDDVLFVYEHELLETANANSVLYSADQITKSALMVLNDASKIKELEELKDGVLAMVMDSGCYSDGEISNKVAKEVGFLVLKKFGWL